jgi:hypothetical protein
VQYHRATHRMNERYPDATASELAFDPTCIICRELMVAGSEDEGGLKLTPKKLPCGHILHFHCLRSWLERQQTCPTCRRSVLETEARNPFIRFFQNGNENPNVNGREHQNENMDANRNMNFNQFNNTRPSPSPSRQTQFQRSNSQIVLPAGYQLPPGWVCIPATSNIEIRSGEDSTDTSGLPTTVPLNSVPLNSGPSKSVLLQQIGELRERLDALAETVQQMSG